MEHPKIQHTVTPSLKLADTTRTVSLSSVAASTDHSTDSNSNVSTAVSTPSSHTSSSSLQQQQPGQQQRDTVDSAGNPITAFPPPQQHPWTLNPPNRSLHKRLRLTDEQIASFDRDGLLIVRARDLWSADELQLLMNSVEQMENWPEVTGRWMKYFERHQQSGERLLQRTENFAQYNEGLNQLLTQGKLIDMCTDLFASEAILYKEKINYKLSGGSGFVAHQDVAAGWWMYGQSLHISVLVCIDTANAENGALEVVYGQHKHGLLGEAWKEIPNSEAEKMQWIIVNTEPGDVVLFDSFVPHRSGPNCSPFRRRALYATYAIACEGDFRERYYADKRKSFPPDIERETGKHYEYKV